MKIAITGGAGFIGSVLAKILKGQGHNVSLLDLKQSDKFPENSMIVDITDKKAVIDAMEGIEVIYHLAAAHRDDVFPIEKYYTVNVKGTENIIAAAKIHKIKRIIFTSTVAVYGLDAGESKESDIPAPFNDYGKSKLAAEKTLAEWAEESQGQENKLVILRLVATFGPGNRGNIYTLMNQIHRGKFVMVGSGKNSKSIAYVENVAAFLVHCLNKDFKDAGMQIYNYSDKPDLSMNELVSDIKKNMGLNGSGLRIPYIAGLTGGIILDLVAKITGKTFPISAVRVRKFCANTVVNADKARKTGFSAPHTLQNGIKEMITATRFSR